MCQGLRRWWDYRFKRYPCVEVWARDGDLIRCHDVTEKEVEQIVRNVDRDRAARYYRHYGADEL